MEPLNLLVLNKAAYGTHRACNDFTGRQTLLPRCLKKWMIEGGPSLPRICAAPADILPWELSRRHGFKHEDNRISGRVPVEFTINPQTGGKYGSNFSVEVIIRSVDTDPDLFALAWSVFGYCSEPLVGQLLECIALKGRFRDLSNNDNTPENLKGSDYRECIIAYNPRQSCGWLGEVAEVQELPSSGVIKDIYVLYEVVRKFAGGFMETYAPDSVRHWGRLNGGNAGSWISCDAVRGKNEEWKYAPSNKDGWSLNLIGVRQLNEDRSYWDKLIGDAFLCSDGTVLHSYYFSQKGWGEKPPTPDGWKDGYYHNRFYPPGSPMIPKDIVASFEREMPAWFYKEDEARKARVSR